ncbi:O-antigen ligase family protein [Shewanella waksmanii]|uniref:O-antigen ligase family protein n=1 Tax=Shewanella waksmanii TaxID=213783 RepID=UPI003734CF79
MDTQTHTPQNSDEKLVWYSISFTYLFWLLGAVYIVAPVIGWVLLLKMLRRYTFNHAPYQIPPAVKTWCIAMFIMLVALIIAHIDYQLGTPKLIKSTIGWAKGWALLAVFPLIGALDIRPEIIYRACCQVCKHTLILLPLFVLAWLVRLPETLYVSPTSIIGGPGPEFFSVSLYEIDPGSGLPRWRLFTPWAPALGMLGNLFSIFALQEKSLKYKLYGLAGALIMILISQSRLAIACYLFIMVYFIFWRYHKQPALYLIASPIVLVAGLFGTHVLEKLESTILAIKAARAGSTRVRGELAHIAIERWSNEAIWWGHGIVERGPHLVEYMPIGSHHTWYGLLFVKGAIGATALAIAMLFSAMSLIRHCASHPLSRVALAVLIMLFLYTFGENLEILAYLFWPGLLIIGIAFKTQLTPSQSDNAS